MYGERLRKFLTTFVESSPLGASRTETERSINRVSVVTMLCTACFGVRFIAFLIGTLSFAHNLFTIPKTIDLVIYPLWYVARTFSPPSDFSLVFVVVSRDM